MVSVEYFWLDLRASLYACLRGCSRVRRHVVWPRRQEWGVDTGTAAGVWRTGQARSPHMVVLQQMLETWTLLCNVSTDSSGHREDQGRSRMWKHAAQRLAPGENTASVKQLCSPQCNRWLLKGDFITESGAAAAGEAGSHIRGDGHPCLWSGCWGWPLTRRAAVGWATRVPW